MYEQHHEPLLPRRAFLSRMLRHGAGAAAVIAFFLAIGMAGYHWIEDLPWIDSYVNAAMIMSGMGPLATLHTATGKIFAGTYAIFSGVVFLTTIGFILAPIAHRVFHHFHAPPAAKRK